MKEGTEAVLRQTSECFNRNSHRPFISTGRPDLMGYEKVYGRALLFEFDRFVFLKLLSDRFKCILFFDNIFGEKA
jgi:hypothetical protein